MSQSPVSISQAEGLGERSEDERFGGVVVGLAAILLMSVLGAFLLDESLVRWVREHAHGLGAGLAKWVGIGGDWYGVALMGVTLWSVAKVRRSTGLQRLVRIMCLSAILSGVSANVIRGVTGRTRPSAAASEGWYGARFGLLGAKGSRHAFQSFPSAHTAVVAGFFSPLGWVALLVHRRRERVFGVILFLGASGLMAWARVWTGSHHPSDVVAALTLGGMVGACLLWGRWRNFTGCLGAGGASGRRGEGRG